MASLSFPPLVSPPVSAVVPAVPAGPALPVGAVPAVAPVALLQAELDSLPLPLPSAATQPPAASAPSAESAAESAAMRPDQVLMARQLSWPSMDGGALASSWRGMVRNYGAQLVNRELQARPGQLPASLLLGGQPNPQDARVLRQGDPALSLDAWRFTVHAGSPRDQHLRVVQREEESQQQQKRRRARAALRLELVLADGTVVTVQAEPVADGLRLELCAPDQLALARLRALQPDLDAAVGRAGLRVVGWKYRDTLPMGPAHIRLPSADAASALSLPVFRAMAELALALPALA